VSTLFFALRVVRVIPRKVPAVERYLALDHVADGDNADDAPDPTGLPHIDRS